MIFLQDVEGRVREIEQEERAEAERAAGIPKRRGAWQARSDAIADKYSKAIAVARIAERAERQATDNEQKERAELGPEPSLESVQEVTT